MSDIYIIYIYIYIDIYIYNIYIYIYRYIYRYIYIYIDIKHYLAATLEHGYQITSREKTNRPIWVER